MAKKNKKSASETQEAEPAGENVDIDSSIDSATEEAKSADDEENNEPSSHEELTLLLEDARAKADEHWNQVLLANAELENSRRRARQDVENAHKFSLEKFTLELLPVKDSLEMGLVAVNSDSDNSQGNEALAHLKEGTELTLKMLTSAMEKFGIEEIGSAGVPFSPDIHQAMSMLESTDHAPNTVIEVIQKGYQLNERLIRPAMVIVSKAITKVEEIESSETGTHVDEKA